MFAVTSGGSHPSWLGYLIGAATSSREQNGEGEEPGKVKQFVTYIGKGPESVWEGNGQDTETAPWEKCFQPWAEAVAAAGV